jgi:AraC-like DNA-binding protein
MNTEIILPIESLRKHIRYFCLLEHTGADFIEKYKIMPNGAPGLIFQENPTAFRDQNNQTLPQLFLFGQAIQYSQLNVKGRFRNIAVVFQPTALKSIFGISANELTNQHIDINCFISTSLGDQLLNSKTLAQKISTLEEFFLKQATAGKAENEKIKFAYTQLQKGEKLKQVQADLKIAERTLERLFKEHIGISPKLYSRICRFQRTLETLRKADRTSVTEIAYLENYFDQSHFTREFKDFAGMTPKSYLNKALERISDISVR